MQFTVCFLETKTRQQNKTKQKKTKKLLNFAVMTNRRSLERKAQFHGARIVAAALVVVLIVLTTQRRAIVAAVALTFVATVGVTCRIVTGLLFSFREFRDKVFFLIVLRRRRVISVAQPLQRIFVVLTASGVDIILDLLVVGRVCASNGV